MGVGNRPLPYMPTYGFKCRCGEVFETIASIKNAPSQAECPTCGDKAERDYNQAPEFRVNWYDPKELNAEADIHQIEIGRGYGKKSRRWV